VTDFRFQYSVAVRFADLDVLVHVNHLAYLEILEAGRVAYYQQVLGMQSVWELGFVLAELRVRYLASALLGQTLVVHFGVRWLKRSSSHFQFELRDQASGQLLAEGEGVQVYVNRETGRSAPLPDSYRQRIEAFEGRPLQPPIS
jgi:acyl-CoA thioester hydrolase